jgi:hypothetical protein
MASVYLHNKTSMTQTGFELDVTDPTSFAVIGFAIALYMRININKFALDKMKISAKPWPQS